MEIFIWMMNKVYNNDEKWISGSDPLENTKLNKSFNFA